MARLEDADLPEVFRQFSQSMWLPLQEREDANNEILMREGLKAVESSRRMELKVFLDKLLDGAYSDHEIERIWHRQRPFFLFESGGLPEFLMMVRDTLSHEA